MMVHAFAYDQNTVIMFGPMTSCIAEQMTERRSAHSTSSMNTVESVWPYAWIAS